MTDEEQFKMREKPNFNCKVMQKFSDLIGFYQPQRSYYGGLVEVKFEDGKLFAFEWVAPKDDHFLELVRRCNLFTIDVSEDDEVKFTCLTGYGKPHSCHIKMDADAQFTFKCLHPKKHDHPEDRVCCICFSPSNPSKKFLEWHMFRRTEPPDTMIDSIVSRNQFEKTKEFVKNCVYKKLEISSTKDSKNKVIRPGLFKASYATHGVEFINLVINDNEVKAYKISGDPNVPANEITFKVDLRNSVTLNATTQATATCDDLAAIPKTPSDNYLNEAQEQTFSVPRNCLNFETSLEIPSRCKWRFQASAQVADDGFKSPMFVPAQWIVFSDDLYAVVFFQINAIFLYKRVDEIASLMS